MIQFANIRAGHEVHQTIREHEPIAASREVELERLGDEIAELAAHLHAATYQLLVRLRDFDERNRLGARFQELRALAELAHEHCAGCGARESARCARAWPAAAAE